MAVQVTLPVQCGRIGKSEVIRDSIFGVFGIFYTRWQQKIAGKAGAIVPVHTGRLLLSIYSGLHESTPRKMKIRVPYYAPFTKLKNGQYFFKAFYLPGVKVLKKRLRRRGLKVR